MYGKLCNILVNRKKGDKIMTTITKHAKCTRWAVLALAILLCAGLFAGCKRQEQENPTGTNPSDSTGGTTDTGDSLYDEDGYLKDRLDPDLDFKGETFDILGWNSGYDSDFYVELSSGDTVSDAVYSRNLVVQDRMKVTLKTNFIDGNNATQDEWVATAMQSVYGGSKYDMFGCYSMCAGTLYVQGGIQSLSALPHLDFEMPWWSASLIEMSELNGELYFLTGDLSNAFLYNLYFLIYNKDMVAAEALDDPRQLVLDGTWTNEAMMEMTRGIWVDNDGVPGLTTGDRVGFASYGQVHMDCFLAATGIPMAAENSEGVFELTEEFTGNTVQELIETLNEWLWDSGDCLYRVTSGDTAYNTIKSGYALFGAVAGSTIKAFRDENWEYGVLPYPKLNAGQESYYTNLGFAYSNFCVPLNAAAPDMSAAVLECMASESYRSSAPTLFEDCMKSRWSAGDEVDSQMFDIIKGNIYVDVNRIFSSRFIWRQGSIALFRYSLTDNDDNWISKIEGEREYINGILADIAQPEIQPEAE